MKSLGKDGRYLKSTIRDVQILGTDRHPSFSRGEALDISCGGGIDAGEMPVVLKITVE